MNSSGQKIQVPAEAVGLRLDKWLSTLYPQIKYGEWARLFRKGHIRLDSKRVKGSERLTEKQWVRLPPAPVLKEAEASNTSPAPKKQSSPLSAQMEKNLKSWIIFEDAEIIVFNKPAGLAVQGGTRQTIHLDGLLQNLGQKTGITFKLVHRLDKDTSGIMVMAKTSKSAAILSDAFKGRKLEKIYVALTQGVPYPMEGTIKDPIQEQVEGTWEKMAIDPAGKKAITHYKVLSHAGRKAACIGLSPATGRTHQLRVHLAGKNCPILGDGQYGDASVFWDNIPNNLYLHAYKITFNHPTLKKNLTFSAPFPPHFIEALHLLGMDEKDILTALKEFQPNS